MEHDAAVALVTLVSWIPSESLSDSQKLDLLDLVQTVCGSDDSVMSRASRTLGIAC